MNDHLQTLDHIKSTAIDAGMRFGPKVFVAIIILIVGFSVGRWVGRMLDRLLRRLDLEPPVRHLLVRVVRILVLGLFAIMALQNLGVELLPLIAGIGLAGAGIALAMQGVLSNIVAGLTIIFTRPFRVGEYISHRGRGGSGGSDQPVQHHAQPYGSLPGRRSEPQDRRRDSAQLRQMRQLNIVVGVAYDTDLNQALAVINEVLQANPRVLKEPAPVIQTIMLADSSVNIGIKPWVTVARLRRRGW